MLINKKKKKKLNLDLVSLFNGISTFLGYLMPKPLKNNGIINPFQTNYSNWKLLKKKKKKKKKSQYW